MILEFNHAIYIYIYTYIITNRSLSENWIVNYYISTENIIINFDNLINNQILNFYSR